MPLYEFACPKCESNFELLIRGGETPECPDCHSRKLEKLLSVPAAHVGGGQSLPICDAPRPAGPCGMGGCGLPECGP
jgi:putative FmdB family regulatory protein